MKRFLSFFIALLLGLACAQAALADNAVPAVSPGDYVTFGLYPQSTKGADNTPIEWLVLEVDGEKALLISRYILDRECYQAARTNVTWETCDLRAWMNGTFIEKAFTEQEADAILVTENVNEDVDWNAVAKMERRDPFTTRSVDVSGGNTQDRVFALSIAEVLQYFPVRESRICAPTDYAVSRGAWSKPGYRDSSRRPAGDWWTRSGGCYPYRAGDVYYNGACRDHEVNYNAIGVRPAMWVKLEALQDPQ